jgi:hypothetical protein
MELRVLIRTESQVTTGGSQASCPVALRVLMRPPRFADHDTPLTLHGPARQCPHKGGSGE